MRYLQDRQHYIDLYDLFTIKECLNMIDFMREVYVKSDKEQEAQGFTKADRAKGTNWFTNQQIYYIRGERYRLKAETIQRWINQDKLKQEKYDNTPEPQNILCPTCKKTVTCALKHLETTEDPLRMMFLFICPKCKKKKWIYEDGTERESTPQLCSQCKAEVKLSLVKESKDKIIWKTTCNSCSFTETIIDDLEKNRIQRKKEVEQDTKLLEIYREHYCSDEKGKESLDYIEALKVGQVIFDEEVKKYDSFAYQKAIRQKKLSAAELEKLISEPFAKNHFIKLSLDKPEMGYHVIIPFSVQDDSLSRKENTSISDLQKLIKDLLEGTNWRLMSDGLSYRLGYITGRFKGHERKEDLLELSGMKKEKESSKIDYETRMKYEGHSLVQMAHLAGEYKGIDNIRRKRLKHEPDGFFLDSPKSFYTCGICHESTSEDRTWWNLDGVRCADCQRNIKEGVIPAEIHKNNGIWIQDFELKSDFNVHPSSVKKLRREGILHGRDLKKDDGTLYCTIYLVDENKEFLKKYPRKSKPKMVITDLLGDKVEL